MKLDFTDQELNTILTIVTKVDPMEMIGICKAIKDKILKYAEEQAAQEDSKEV